jgi:hypothetical protein
MNLSRIRYAIPWRIALILTLVPCLPLLTFWGWLRWEVPPLQRYYLAAYWHSSEAAEQPGAQTQIQWLMKTAPGRKGRWCIGSDVTDGSQNGVSLKLSPTALGQGWIGIEKTSVESMDAAELEGILRQDFFDGQSFSQLANEPLLGGAAALIIGAYLAFMMREDLAYEWRRLRRVVGESEWGSSSGSYWPENREGIGTRIRSRSARWNAEISGQLKWANFKAVISRRSSVDRRPNPESLQGSHRPTSTEVQNEVLIAQ